MNKSLLIALCLMALVVVIIINNNAGITLNLLVSKITAKESLVLLGFYISGIVTGVLLKG